jgi:hypothetical protein
MSNTFIKIAIKKNRYIIKKDIRNDIKLILTIQTNFYLFIGFLL